MFDISHGTVTQEEADRLAGAAGQIDTEPHAAGSTEPWVSRLVADFIVARGARTVLETGAYMGATSVWIADALRRLGGGRFFLCEIDKARRGLAVDRLVNKNWLEVELLERGDVMEFLRATPETFDVAWVDDNHTKKHVTAELTLLYPKMNPGGLILLHDVYGVTDLRTVVAQFGGYSIDLWRLGPAGGIGVIQVPF
jgi:predicted O-methyltransferase YrrM